MAKITVKRGRSGTAVITMKAGKGEDLRNVVYALAGIEPPEEKSPEEMRLENERLRGDRETFHHPV